MKKALFMALVLVMVMSTSVALADGPQSVLGADPDGAGPLTVTANLPVQIAASVPAKVILSVDDDFLDAGILDPELPGPQWTGSVTVTTKSNVLCTLSRADANVMNGGLTPTFAAAWTGAPTLINLRGTNNFVDNYSISVDYNVVPAAYTETVTYTLVQE